MADTLKTVVVSDAFMHEEYYRRCFEKFPEYEITHALFFGTQDRLSMRDPIHHMERNGPDTLEPPAELYDAIEDADVLMVHVCPVNRRLLARAKRLKVILTNRGGLENIDVAAATELGIPVLNNPAHNANSVAELTLCLMISEMRNIARTHANMMQHKWVEFYHNAGQVHEISGSVVGIIGFGNIGRRVARKLTVFDCKKVLVYDKYVPADDPDLAKYGCEFVDLETLLRESDIVTLHVRSDECVLFREHFDMMKPSAYFINCARSHLIDNQALYENLRDNKLMGSAFDVYPREPIRPDEPYASLDNTTLSNHRGGDTENCYSDSPAALLTQFNRMRAGEKPRFWANEEALRARG